ncbi:unnamed protein product [Clavelina lepadiformis]|uniref:Uncharacterized protein n=1 Tax=Clavelina lepadiformis TaxID=159417 RepID=A0ABP0EXT7_CLALP
MEPHSNSLVRSNKSYNRQCHKEGYGKLCDRADGGVQLRRTSLTNVEERKSSSEDGPINLTRKASSSSIEPSTYCMSSPSSDVNDKDRSHPSLCSKKRRASTDEFFNPTSSTKPTPNYKFVDDVVKHYENLQQSYKPEIEMEMVENPGWRMILSFSLSCAEHSASSKKMVDFH